MKNLIIFDFLGTLAKMRPPKALVSVKSLSMLAQNNQLAIITGGKETEVMNILKAIGFTKFFPREFIITADDTPLRKPDPKLVQMMRQRGNFDQIVFIGDLVRDYKLAQKSGIKFVFVGKRKIGDAQLGYATSQIEKVITNLLLSGSNSGSPSTSLRN